MVDRLPFVLSLTYQMNLRAASSFIMMMLHHRVPWRIRATLISQQDRALTLPVLDLFLGDPSSHGMEQFMLIEHSLRTRIPFIGEHRDDYTR
jgi:hypothetical protein